MHLLKNFRGKLIDYKIQLFPDGGLIICDELNEVLQIGMALNDKTQLSRMRDSNVLQLFSFSNFIKLIENGLGNAALIFFVMHVLSLQFFQEILLFQ